MESSNHFLNTKPLNGVNLMKTSKKRNVRTLHRHTNSNALPKRKRGADSVVIQLTTTANLVEVLDQVVKTGFFGTSRAAAAERLLAEALRDLLKEGTIQKRQRAFD